VDRLTSRGGSLGKSVKLGGLRDEDRSGPHRMSADRVDGVARLAGHEQPARAVGADVIVGLPGVGLSRAGGAALLSSSPRGSGEERSESASVSPSGAEWRAPGGPW
jgi:hypothetical protein